MGAIMVNGPDTPEVESAEEMAGRFHGELISQFPDWKQRLADDPSQLENLERDVHAAFDRGADLVVAGLIAMVMKRDDFQQTAKQTQENYRIPLTAGRSRTHRVRLLGGLFIWVASLYCSPRKQSSKEVQENIPGLHIELAPFGFGKNCSPGLESRVARQAAICPSMQLARQELERGGVTMDVKAVRRVATQCGEGLLALRREELFQWRKGELPSGSELKGKAVSVQIDGGRTRIRGDLRPAPPAAEAKDADGLPLENAPGRSKKRAKQTFDANWREPKLVTIFVHDEQGRMTKQSKATVDGTFLGPDAICELIAMHLHRLGAAEAISVTFVADGAPWIWERLPTIVRLAKLKDVRVHEVLDCSHACHHISLALAAMGQSQAQRIPLYREHRTLLRNGQWRRVVDELTDLANEYPENKDVRTEIAYLEKHGLAGRLKYPHFRSIGVPIGSGAIESNIRRVINLRLKGNGIFWREENAEAMLQVRSQVITDRWDERLTKMRQHLAYDGRRDWTWEPVVMNIKC